MENINNKWISQRDGGGQQTVQYLIISGWLSNVGQLGWWDRRERESINRNEDLIEFDYGKGLHIKTVFGKRTI